MEITKFVANTEKSSILVEGVMPNPFEGRVAELLFATKHGRDLFFISALYETFSRFNDLYPIPLKVDLIRFEEQSGDDTFAFAFKIKSFAFGKDRYNTGGYYTVEQQQEIIARSVPFTTEKIVHWMANHMHTTTILGRIAKYFPRIAEYGYVYEHTNGFSRLAEQLRIELRSSSERYHEGHTTTTLIQAITHSRATGLLVSEEAITNLFRAICIPHGVNPNLVTGKF